jgi:diadenosine tetraphosphate (Ap4A) HIT family hydrolase
MDWRTPKKMSDTFEMHPQFSASTFHVTTLGICRVLLAKDARFPWLILVPEVNGLTDWHEVPAPLQPTILADVNHAAATLKRLTNADKMNVASLGNQVAQLHIHVIARNVNDAAWPNPVWGEGTPEPYTDDAGAAFLESIEQALRTGPR